MVNDECTLNAVVEQVVMNDPEFADTNVDEKTIKSRVRRQLVNGLNGSAETKNGMTAQGISYDDGYNYWYKVDNSKDGAAKHFIQRGKDFQNDCEFHCFKLFQIMCKCLCCLVQRSVSIMCL